MLFQQINDSGYKRLVTREVKVGNLLLGNLHPVRVQTMTTTDTMNTMATVEQSIRCIEAGAELVRITAPSKKEAENLRNIKDELVRRGYNTPLVADIHFTPNAAEIAARIIEKVRVNPGNYVDKKKFELIEYTDADYAEEIERITERFTPLVRICKEYGTAMRIGTNHGSLSDRIMSRYGDTPMGMVESAMEFLRVARYESYHNIVLSMKSSNPQVMVQAYRMLVEKMFDEFGECYPLHLGVTEAGDGEDGRIKSAIGIGSLLEEGLGDTIRVSLTEDPEFEIPVCKDIVKRYGPSATTSQPKQDSIRGSGSTKTKEEENGTKNSSISNLSSPTGGQGAAAKVPSQREGVENFLSIFEEETVGYRYADPSVYGLLKAYAQQHRATPTDAEEVMWELLKTKKLEGYKFRRQHIIDRFITDFVCLKQKLVIEIDGLIHQLPDNQASDLQRTEKLGEIGFTVIRFTNEQVLNETEYTLQKILSALKRQEEANTETNPAKKSSFSHLSSPTGGQEAAAKAPSQWEGVQDSLSILEEETVGYRYADPSVYGLLKAYAQQHRATPTDAEEVMWELLKTKKLEGYKFRRQHIIDRFITDFVCLKQKLVIEIDGLLHQLPDNQASDLQRTEKLSEIGFNVIRFTNEQVLNETEYTLQNILSALKRQEEVNTETNPAKKSSISHLSSPTGGQGAVPIVIADLSKLQSISQKALQSVGYTYNAISDKWSIADGAADFIFTGHTIIDFALPGTLKVIVYPATWLAVQTGTSAIENVATESYVPIFDIEGYLASEVKGALNFVMFDCEQYEGALKNLQHLDKLAADPSVVLCLSSRDSRPVDSLRLMFEALQERNVTNRTVLVVDSDWQTADEHLVHYAIEAGALLLEGLGDGICLGMTPQAYSNFNNNLSGRRYASHTGAGREAAEQFLNNTAFSILQATRRRISKTEYISCPSCGRTLFDLQETTAKIRAVTNHLKGVKIAIMGCIVNGPGEMADADFGYVGSGPGKITLYKGKEVVKRNVPSEIAVQELIQLLKDSGAWIESQDVFDTTIKEKAIEENINTGV